MFYCYHIRQNRAKHDEFRTFRNETNTETKKEKIIPFSIGMQTAVFSRFSRKFSKIYVVSSGTVFLLCDLLQYGRERGLEFLHSLTTVSLYYISCSELHSLVG